MNNLYICGDISDLINLVEDAEERTGFEHGRIKVYQEDNTWYEIYIDHNVWSNHLTIEEADADIRSLIKGIELATKPKEKNMHTVSITMEMASRLCKTYEVPEAVYDEMCRTGKIPDDYFNQMAELVSQSIDDVSYDYAVYDEDTCKDIITWN